MDLSNYGNIDPDAPTVPNGKYKCIINKADERRTNSGDGSYIALEFEVVEGTERGSRLWQNLNLVNPNPKAVQFAERDFAKIKRALGLTVVKHESEMLNIPFMIELKNYKKDGEWKQGLKYSSCADEAETINEFSMDENPF